MFKKSLFAMTIAAALGLSMTAAQARDFDHRDNGFRHTEHHGQFRHGHHARHHHGNRHHFARHDGRR